MRNFTRTWVFVILFIMHLGGAAAPTSGRAASSPDVKANRSNAASQEKWDQTVTAARREGKLRIYGDLSAETRQSIAKHLKAKYGLEVDVITAKGAEMSQRLVREQTAGLYLADAIMAGATTSLTDLKPKGMLQRLDSLLILPEILNPAAWPNGKFPYMDDGHTAVALAAGVTPYIVVNTQQVKEGSVKSFQDLLKPEYKGKMVFFDPTMGGTGVAWISFLMTKVYKNDREGLYGYLRQFAAQEPIILKDKRLQMEWVAKGKYPIAVCSEVQVVTDFVAAGAPVKRIHAAEGTGIGPAAALLSIPLRPEHPHASTVLLNWLLTDEGQRNFSTAFGSAAVRVGVKTVVRDPSGVPAPGDRLIWQDEEFYLRTAEAKKVAKEIFGPLMR